MQKAPIVKISDAEWEVMRVIWANQPVTSRFITEVLSVQMDWKAATIKTLIGRLVEKGFVSTEQAGKKYLYAALVSEEESIKELTTNILDQICARKVGTTIAQQIEQALLSKADIQLLEEAIRKKKHQAVEKIVCNCLAGQCHCKHSHEGGN